jgi:hypothetical protein
MSTETQPRAGFGTTKKNVPGVLTRSQIMYNFILENVAMFASPPITMVAFLALIGALSTAQQIATGTKAKGSAAVRNTKRNAVWTAMESVRIYVQGLADSLSVEDAVSLIESAGLLVETTSRAQKALLAASLTATAGTVHLVANRSMLVGPGGTSKKVTFFWQVSLDGKTWSDLPGTGYASINATGLTLMTTYTFRVSVTVGKVTGTWSQPVSLLVH